MPRPHFCAQHRADEYADEEAQGVLLEQSALARHPAREADSVVTARQVASGNVSRPLGLSDQNLEIAARVINKNPENRS